MRVWFAAAIVIAAGLVGLPSDLRAQTNQPPIIPPLVIPPPQAEAKPAVVELEPFGGYRFGGDFFELITGQRVDLDGAPVWGVAVDLPIAHLARGLSFEGLFTHQHANLVVPSLSTGFPKVWHITVEHWQAGVLQEVDKGQVRPFVELMAGLTRYAGEGDNEIRFAASGGAGVKLLPARRLGIRMESRVFATFVDVAGALACSGGCLLALSAEVVWQWEFSAGLIVRIR
jgi:hypothetical protein